MPGRRLALALTLVSLAVFIASVIPMASRVRAFNRTANFARLHAEVKSQREFKLTAFPAVKLTDDFDDAGRAALRLNFGDAVRLIPVKPPPFRDMPNLAAYEEWAKVLAINQVRVDDDGRSAPAPGSERLLIVVRRTPDGFDPGSWGTVRRVEWLFDIYDLKPDGEVSMTTYRWPRSERSERGLRRRTQSEDARVDQVALAALPRLQERSVEYFAAMHVIPKLNVPEHKFNDTAFSPGVLGWTLPVSMFSLLTCSGGLAFALGGRRTPKNGESAKIRP